ncbi:aminodeoxychorismate synthase component I [Falsirhodobacter xinxiangensis]|uniref:aminodeoxychorismate synthase component I n=1 Tax=Falsirhodobacter xinxiangensis TaxID=2530049 RepID=UPI0010A9F8F3|nr:aminodeoxychorismate synthase component I [Rhodobacter xinxiangensis]
MIILDDGPEGRAAEFRSPREVVVADRLPDVLPALRRLEEARRGGGWVAGWMAYEAGFAFEARLSSLDVPGQPLLAFGIFDVPTQPQSHHAAPVRLAPPEPVITREAYGEAFRQTQALIAAGDVYQINLTFPMQTRLLHGTAADLAAALTHLQPVAHGGFADLGVGPTVISRSPELFFRTDASGRIEARPMKGTAPRHPDPAQDAALAAALGASVKNRAENLMIVDLLRNDLSRLSRVGSVRVPDLFDVETFATVHQMTSRVTAQLAAPPDLCTLMQALFPCGSITGAPKIRAMQIIHALEPHPRGIYCGTLGWMGPDGSSSFSVAIRTLALRGDEITLNVGGGIVADSTESSEWEEALWKARYMMPLVQG